MHEFMRRCGLVGRCVFFFQAEDGIRDIGVTGVQTCALPISRLSVTTYSTSSAVVSVPIGTACVLPYHEVRLAVKRQRGKVLREVAGGGKGGEGWGRSGGEKTGDGDRVGSGGGRAKNSLSRGSRGAGTRG